MSVSPSRLLRRLRAGAVLIGLGALLGITSQAAADTPDELREERKEVQEEAADLAVDVDALTDNIDDLVVALEALSDAVDAQQAALDAANRRVRDAETAELVAEVAVDRLVAEMGTTQELLRRSAVDAYVDFQGPNGDHAALSSDPWQRARTAALVEFGTGSTTEIIDRLRALGADLEAEQRAAAAHIIEVDELRDEVEERATALAAALAREEDALSAVEDRLDARLAEVAALESLDAQLAAEIRAEEQRIADAIAARRRAREGLINIPDNSPVELTTVRGIVVNVLVADSLEGLLAAMEARGYTLSGGGYRSSDSQTALRRAHCGTSEYAIWQMPASQCRPPTARPGRSAHERGLAVDFTYRGSIIRSGSSDVYQALSAVARDFGFRPLPGEPWHWSTNGN